MICELFPSSLQPSGILSILGCSVDFLSVISFVPFSHPQKVLPPVLYIDLLTFPPFVTTIMTSFTPWGQYWFPATYLYLPAIDRIVFMWSEIRVALIDNSTGFKDIDLRASSRQARHNQQGTAHFCTWYWFSGVYRSCCVWCLSKSA